MRAVDLHRHMHDARHRQATPLPERRSSPGAGPALETLHCLAVFCLTALAALCVFLPLAILFVEVQP